MPPSMMDVGAGDVIALPPDDGEGEARDDEEDVGDEAREGKAVELLHRRRFEEEREKWLKEIRDESFVEIRL